MSLRKPHQGVISQPLPAFFPQRMGVVSTAWSNASTSQYTPAGLYNNANDGSFLVVWGAEMMIAPSGSAPATYTPEIDLTISTGTVINVAPAFVAVNGQLNNSTTHDIVPMPNGVTAGMVLVAITSNPGQSGVQTPPAGWVAINSRQTLGAGTIYSWYKVAGANEPATYTWEDTQSNNLIGAIAAYTGVDTGTPPDSFANGSAASANQTSTAVTMTRSGCMGICAYFHQSAGISYVNGPVAMNTRDTRGRQLIADINLATPTLPAETAVVASSDNGVNLSFGLRPAAIPTVLSAPQPLVAGYRVPWGQLYVGTQAVAQVGTPYYKALAGVGPMTTSAGVWRWPYPYPLAVLPPGAALLANLTLVSNAWLSFTYEVTAGY